MVNQQTAAMQLPATQTPATQTPALFAEEQAMLPAEEQYEIEVDGEVLRLTLPQLMEAARLGLSRQCQHIRRENAARAVPNGEIYAAFLQEYPDVQPSDIPPEVWALAAREGSLLSAFRRFELDRLRAELEALRKNEDNRAREIGPARSDGETLAADPVIRALLGSGTR